MLTAALLVLVLLAVGLWKGWHARPRVDKALPGPRAFPLIGDIPHLFHADLPLHFLKLAQRYGPIYRLRFGRKDVVVLNSSDLIREALIRKWSDFAGRPHSFVADLISLGGKDLSLGNYSPTWRLQRKMAHTALQRSLRGDLEPTVQDKAQCLCKVLHGHGGKPVDVAHIFSLHTSWVISTLVFGPLDLSVVEKMHDCMIDLVESWNAFSVQILDVLPFLKVFPNPSLQRLLCLIKRRDTLIQSQMKKCQETQQPAEARTLADRMLHFAREHEAGKPGDAALTQEHVHMAIVDLLIGGTETTAALLTWVVAFLLHHPRVEEQIHQELMAVVGLSRDPTYSDREQLPYLSATILETLRLRPSAPLALPHTATRDTRYQIPTSSVPASPPVITGLLAPPLGPGICPLP
ncbi:Steroid 21-hydroxylase [Varanus komodoensis]|nr:Steroid 21-hydroxylase [Varanus komodoensis]